MWWLLLYLNCSCRGTGISILSVDTANREKIVSRWHERIDMSFDKLTPAAPGLGHKELASVAL